MNNTSRILLFLLLLATLAGIPASLEAVTVSDRIPHRVVYAVRAFSPTDVWIGTEQGAAHYDGKAWSVYTVADGLPHDVVTSVARHPTDGSLWFGTFGGVARFANGRFERFTVANSGLVNDVVYGLTVTLPYVWIATTNGISRFGLADRSWKTFDDKNTKMHEVWIYGVSSEPNGRGDTWFAIWGSGMLRIREDGTIDSYADPDEIFDVDVVRNDGPLHEIQVAISAVGNVVYSGAYFGLTRYDGKNWNTWTVKDSDSGLPSDFINTVKMSPDGRLCAIGTDKGLCIHDFARGKWVTYRRNTRGPGGELLTFENGTWKTETTPEAPAGDFVWAVDFVGDTLWVGTASGLYTVSLKL
ncbi:MAG TPA: hypothetical protein PLP29_18430 [Candidatus Ozemobacteraceae bacterium]|nr:hypothetical protein [Candidatus Ozemobacteraceae bacterium]